MLLDPKELEVKKIPAYRSDRTAGMGTLIPLERTQADEAAPKLAIRFVAADDDARNLKLELRFGPHVLTAAVTLDLDAPAEKRSPRKR